MHSHSVTLYDDNDDDDCATTLNHRDCPHQRRRRHFHLEQQSEGDFSNVLVIQGNDQVVTAFDKAVGVRCSFPVGNKTLRGETSLHIK